MSSAIDASPDSFTMRRKESIAELLDQLGGISAERVLLHPFPGTATESDFILFNESRGIQCELIDRTLVEKAMGIRESIVAGIILSILRAFVLPRRLGFLLGPDGMFRLIGDQLRLPDVAYVSFQTWPDGVPETAISKFAPDLAVEVLSDSNTPREIHRKRQELFASGTKLVWVVDPELRVVDVYTAVENPTRLTSEQVIDGGNVLQGFSVRVGDFFADLDIKGPAATR
jgi:Uma2 family endonuclease